VLVDNALATARDGYNPASPDLVVSGSRVYLTWMDQRDEENHLGDNWEVYVTSFLKNQLPDPEKDTRVSDCAYGDYTGPPDPSPSATRHSPT